MLEVNAIYFILLVEGFVLLLVLLLVWVLITLIGKRRKRRNIAELESRVRRSKPLRAEQTRSFLQAVYCLEGDDLATALTSIEREEGAFFQQLLDSLYPGGAAPINGIDGALDKLIESYKCLPPHSVVALPEAELELVSLRGENEILRNELESAENKLSDTIAEFGDMFGGGKNHQLAFHEIVERIGAMKAANAAQGSVKTQK